MKAPTIAPKYNKIVFFRAETLFYFRPISRIEATPIKSAFHWCCFAAFFYYSQRSCTRDRTRRTLQFWAFIYLEKILKWTFGCSLVQIHDLFIVYSKWETLFADWRFEKNQKSCSLKCKIRKILEMFFYYAASLLRKELDFSIFWQNSKMNVRLFFAINTRSIYTVEQIREIVRWLAVREKWKKLFAKV